MCCGMLQWLAASNPTDRHAYVSRRYPRHTQKTLHCIHCQLHEYWSTCCHRAIACNICHRRTIPPNDLHRLVCFAKNRNLHSQDIHRRRRSERCSRCLNRSEDIPTLAFSWQSLQADNNYWCKRLCRCLGSCVNTIHAPHTNLSGTQWYTTSFRCLCVYIYMYIFARMRDVFPPTCPILMQACVANWKHDKRNVQK